MEFKVPWSLLLESVVYSLLLFFSLTKILITNFLSQNLTDFLNADLEKAVVKC